MGSLAMDSETPYAPKRRRLPNRRPAETRDVAINGMCLTATIGFDAAGRPAEVFLSGAKDGSTMAAILDDASVVISVALQHGIPATALAKSISRLPVAALAPPYRRNRRNSAAVASIIGAALDLIAAYP